MQEQEKQSSPSFFLNEVGQNFIAGLILAISIIVVGYQWPSVIERLNNLIIDTQIALLPKENISPLPVIVAVDEKSLATYGQWPWPRFQVAKLITAIHNAGASAIAIDALFVEPDRTSPLAVQHDLKTHFNQTLANTTGSATNNPLPDYDSILGSTLQNGPYVLSYMFSFTSLRQNSCLPKATGSKRQIDNAAAVQFFKAHNTVCNIPILQNQANYSGFINSAPDDDGLYRKTPLLIEYQNTLYPNLALQTYLAAKSIKQFSVSSSDTGLLLHLNDKSVPLDNAGNLRIKLPQNQQVFNKISAADVLSGAIKTADLQYKTVLIGFSAAGLHEFRPTPYDSQFLGVDLHAAVLDNLDRGSFLERPNSADWLEILLGASLSLGLMIGLLRTKPLISTLIPLVVMLILLAGSQHILATSGIIISPAIPMLMLLITSMALTLLKYIREYLKSRALTQLVSLTQEGIIESFCSMSEYRDPETGAHIKRTQNYIKALAEHLKQHPKFHKILTPDTIELLYKAAPLHDIGKIGIRDHILLKPERLQDDEFTVMQSHTVIGAEIVKAVAAQIGWNPFMKIAHQISLHHQEKWDGSGYPHGLQGEAIPLPARFMALADVYDALISKRVYKPAMSHNTAVAIIKAGKGIHFDPLLVEGFVQIHEQFRDIALQFLDDNDQRETLLANE